MLTRDEKDMSRILAWMREETGGSLDLSGLKNLSDGDAILLPAVGFGAKETVRLLGLMVDRDVMIKSGPMRWRMAGRPLR